MRKLSIFFFSILISIQSYGAPSLSMSVPANGSMGISTTTKIVLKFTEAVVVGTGNCQLNGVTLTPSIASTYVTFTPNPLEYFTSYTFTVPAGAFRNQSGVDFQGTTLTFTTIAKPQPSAKLYDAVVAKDGSGNYTTVQKAIDAMPENRTQPWLVFIKNGVYNELVRIPSNKPHLHLIGQDKNKTVIQFKLNAGGDPNDLATYNFSSTKLGLSSASVMMVESTDFFSENISYINTWGTEMLNGPMALAIHDRSDKAVFNNCRMLSYQDTWQTNGRHYVKNCFIEGAVDFIYGGGDCYFDSCTLNIARDGSVIVAPAHASEKWGYIFMNCNLSASKYWGTNLGRPWHNAPKTSFVNTTLSKNVYIYSGGWSQMGAIPAIFADYNTRTSLGVPVDLSQRISHYYYTDGNTGLKVEGDAKNKLTAEEVASYTVRNVLSGTDAWKPDEMTSLIGSPVVQKNNDQLRWNRIPYAICYVVTRNDSVVGFTKDTTFTMTEVGTYQIQTANENGGLSMLSIAFSKTSSAINNTFHSNASVILCKNSLRITNKKYPISLKRYSMTGQLLETKILHKDLDWTFDQETACIIRLTDESGSQTFKYLP